MASPDLQRAQQLIQQMQSELEHFRKDTYKAVHDDIGSTLSAASIKAKLLGDKMTDPTIKKQTTEMHSLIKESMEYVTTLNRQLKNGWTPLSKETFFDDLLRELNGVGQKYNINVKIDVKNSSPISFALMMLIYDWTASYTKNAVSRLASDVTFHAEFKSDKIEIQMSDNGFTSPTKDSFRAIAEKKDSSGSKFVLGTKDNPSKLSIPMENKA